MVTIFGSKPQPPKREAAQGLHSKGAYARILVEAVKGFLGFGQWTERQPHPANMPKYPDWASDPQVRVAIDLLTDMVAGSGYYTQMPEYDADGKEVDPEHDNLRTVDNYLKDTGFRDKYKQIQRQKYEMGFCAAEKLSDGSLKILPSDSIYIYRSQKGEVRKYTQEYNNQVVAQWSATDPNFLIFIHNEDPMHPYGRSITDSVGGLVEANKQLNLDMPRIIHRYSSPLGVWEFSRDITAIKDAVTNREVDEDIFLGNVDKEELRYQFHEPATQTRFLEYIDQINFQLGQALHAPLILLLKNATEASATKMLEAVDRAVKGEQEQNADIIERQLFKPLCGEPTPEFLHGATDEVLNGIPLTDISTLKSTSTITWKQAQDLIRKKGIDLIEDVEPQPLPILQNKDPETGKPMLNGDKINQAELSLRTVKQAYDAGKILISEAMKEGDRIIKIYVDKALFEAERQTRESTGKPMATESIKHFDIIRQSLLADFRNSLLPTGG